MFQLKNVLILAAGALFACGLTACDSDDDDDDDGGADEVAYTVLKITDTSADENAAGTPGVDICSVKVTCDDDVNLTDSKITIGSGMVCTGDKLGGTGCESGIDRASTKALESEVCDTKDANGVSAYASIGMGGVLTVTFADNIAGCDLVVGELVGKDKETFKVELCTADGDCVNVGNGEADSASNAWSTTLPAADDSDAE